VWPSRQFIGVFRSSLKSTVSSLWMPVSGWGVIRELRDSLPTSPLFGYAIPKRLLRNHPNRPKPRLHQLRPCRHRKLRSPQSERVPSLSIQMHLHGSASVLQRNVVSKRVVYVVHVVILVLQQERRRRLGGHWNFGIQRKMFIGRRRMRNHELFGALLSIPFRRGKRQMAWIDGHRKVRSATFFVGDINSRVQTLRVVRADRCRQMPT